MTDETEREREKEQKIDLDSLLVSSNRIDQSVDHGKMFIIVPVRLSRQKKKQLDCKSRTKTQQK